MKTIKLIWMKKAICALFALLLSAFLFAMDMKDSILLNAGANIGAFQPHFAGDDKIDNSLHVGGRLQFDYMLTQYVSLGLESGFSTAKIGDTDYSIGTIPILARIAWHPFVLEKLDPYIIGKFGYGFGFFTSQGNDYDWTDVCGGFTWSLNLGTRFFFTEKIGIFAEAGYECLDVNWNHPNMELEKWEESASARTFGIIGITLRN
jgi:hypothetical protein